MTGFDFSFYEAPELKLTLRGLDRIVKHAPSRAPLVTPALLRDLIKIAHPTSPKDLVFFCAFLFAFSLFSRVSNLAPESATVYEEIFAGGKFWLSKNVFAFARANSGACLCHGLSLGFIHRHYQITIRFSFQASSLASIGLSNSIQFRGHSFRRGGATWAFKNGVPGEMIQVYSGRASDAY